MIILWSFSCSFVKFYCKKNWETEKDHVISKSRCVIKGLHCNESDHEEERSQKLQDSKPWL